MGSLVRLRNIKRALKIENPNESVKYVIAGRVNRIRNYRSKNFVDLVDGSTNKHLQVIVPKNILKKPQLGSYLSCQGNLVPSPGVQQELEFKVEKLNYIGECNPDTYPYTDADLYRYPKSWFRRHIHLRPRAGHFSSLLRIRSELELGLHMIMKQMDFVKVHTPGITSNDSEATSDLFTVQRTKLKPATNASVKAFEETTNNTDKDDQEDEEQDELQDVCTSSKERKEDNLTNTTTMTQDDLQTARQRFAQRTTDYGFFHKNVFMITSAQLHLESLAAALSRVYCVSTAYRAENSMSRHHLSEFVMFEAEESNVTELSTLMDRVESIVKFVALFLGEISEHRDDFMGLVKMNENELNYERLAHKEYVRLSYCDAMETLRNKVRQPFDGSTKYGSDIGKKHERALLEYCNNVPIFVTNYPKHLKPFYMKCTSAQSDKTDPSAANQKEALCFDLIAPFGGEICGGSLREDDLDELKKNLQEHWRNVSYLNSDRSKLSPEAKCRSRQRDSSKTEESLLKSSAIDNNDNRLAKLFNDNGNINDTIRSAAWNNEEESELSKRMDWYLDLRRYGTFPHGGFGIGFERLCQALLGIRSIKDTIAFPRSIGSCPM